MLLCNLALKGAEIVIDHLPDYLVVLHPVTKRTIAAKKKSFADAGTTDGRETEKRKRGGGRK